MTLKEKIIAWHRGVKKNAISDFAKELNVQQPRVSLWLKGRNWPDEEIKPRVCRLLGMSPVEFDKLRPLPPVVREWGPGDYARKDETLVLLDATSPGAFRFFSVPVLGSVCAERFNFSFDAIPDEMIPNPYAGKDDVFALKISGDCMEPTLHDSEYIYLRRSQPVTDGKIVLARLDGEHTLKRYFKRPGGIELRPDNQKYKSRTYATNKLEIVAVAIGKYGKL